MNIMIATVGVDPGWLSARGGSSGSLCVAALSVAGLVLLVVALRLLCCRRPGPHPHRCEF